MKDPLQSVEVSVQFLHNLQHALGKDRIHADIRRILLLAIAEYLKPRYDYEVSPTRIEGDDAYVCEEADAQQWSVYKRPRISDEHGVRPAEWVADCVSRDIAQALADALQAKEDE